MSAEFPKIPRVEKIAEVIRLLGEARNLLDTETLESPQFYRGKLYAVSDALDGVEEMYRNLEEVARGGAL